MDHLAALAVLGLEDDAELTRDRVRRTYLRKVREHSPERDPEGFRRVREAFEVLRYLPTPEERAEWARLAELDEQVVDGDDATTASPAEEVSDLGGDGVDPADLQLPPEFLLGVRLEAMLEEVLGLLAGGEIDRAVDVHATWKAAANDDDHRWVGPFTAMRWLLTRELLGISPAVAPEVVSAIAAGIAANDFDIARPRLVAFRRANPEKGNDAAVVLLQRTLVLSKQVDDALDGPVRRAMSRLERRIRPIAIVVGPILLLVLFAVQAKNRDDDRAEERKNSLVASPPSPAGTDRKVLLEEILVSTNALQTMRFPAYTLGSFATEGHLDAQRCPELVATFVELEKSVLLSNPERQQEAQDHMAAIRLRVDLLCPPEPR